MRSCCGMLCHLYTSIYANLSQEKLWDEAKNPHTLVGIRKIPLMINRNLFVIQLCCWNAHFFVLIIAAYHRPRRLWFNQLLIKFADRCQWKRKTLALLIVNFSKQKALFALQSFLANHLTLKPKFINLINWHEKFAVYEVFVMLEVEVSEDKFIGKKNGRRRKKTWKISQNLIVCVFHVYVHAVCLNAWLVPCLPSVSTFKTLLVLFTLLFQPLHHLFLELPQPTSLSPSKLPPAYESVFSSSHHLSKPLQFIVLRKQISFVDFLEGFSA